MKKTYRILASVVGLSLFFPFTAPAVNLDLIDLNGFVSQGYLDSSGNNFLSDSKTGTTQLNEVALTATSQVTPKLRLGAQFLSRDVGEAGNNAVRLDWGLGDYHYHDLLGVRVGKVKLPYGLYGEGRDSDFLRAMVHLPQSIYDENKRNLMVAYQGAGIYGNAPAGAAGDLDYHLFYGELNWPDDSPMLDGFKILTQGVAMKKGFGSVTDFDPSVKYVYGGKMIYNSALDGLRLGGSWFEGATDLDITTLSPSPAMFTTRKGEIQNKNNFVLSFEYSSASLTFASEYSKFDITKELFGSFVPSGRSEMWYAILTYTLSERLSVSALYDRFFDDKDDKSGDNFARQGQPDFLGWRRDFGLAVKYDATPNWIVKAEFHVINGAALETIVFNEIGDLEEHWNYLALKTSYVFK